MLNFIYLFILPSLIKAYFIDLNKVYNLSWVYESEYIASATVVEYDFGYKSTKLYVTYCDPLTTCDGELQITYCMLKPNCWNYFNKLTNHFDENFDLPFAIGTSALYILKYTLRDSPGNQCYEKYIVDHGYNRHLINDTSLYYFRKVGTTFIARILMLDNDWYMWNTYYQLYGYWFRNMTARADGLDHPVKYISVRHRKIFTYYNAYLYSLYKFQCALRTFGYSCLFLCNDNIRRKCLYKLVKYRNRFIYENCTLGWDYLKFKIFYYGPSCGPYPKAIVQTVNLNMCVLRDKCIYGNNCKPPYLCILKGNASFKCVLPKIHLKTEKFNLGLSEDPYLVLPDTMITFVIYNLPSPVDKLSNIYTLYNKKFPTYICKTFECRVNRNRPMLCNRIRLIFQKGIYFGYDYLVDTIMQIDNKYHELRKTFNFTVIKIPTNISLEETFYYDIYKPYNVTFSGFPPNRIFVTVALNNITLITLKKNDSLSLIVWVTGFIKLSLNCWIEFAVKKHTFITTDKYVSLKAFEYFKWKDYYKFTYTKDDDIQCLVKSKASFDVQISILYGDSYYNAVPGTKMGLKGLMSGFFKVVCNVFIPAIGKVFMRIKSFDLFSEPKMLCYLPFGMMRGMLIKCTSDIYPPNLGKYNMTLTNLITNKIIEQTEMNALRIPYVIEHKAIFQLSCYFSYDDKKKSKIHKIVLQRTLELWESTHIFQQFTFEDCYKYASIPQEYDYTSGNDGEMIFYPKNYYVDPNRFDFYLNLTFCSFLTAFFQYLIFIVSIFSRFQNKSQVQVELLKKNKILWVRKNVRKINDCHFKKIHELTLVPVHFTSFRGSKIIPKDFNLLNMQGEFL